ncbi:MAG: hypothetical protein WC807_20180 [Hyphomicrobium sp.]
MPRRPSNPTDISRAVSAQPREQGVRALRILQGDLANGIVQPNSPDRPTPQAYGDLEFAANVFNERLFGGKVPPILFSYARKPRSAGYFSAERFAKRGGEHAHEVGLNPKFLEALGDYKALAILTHVLCLVHRYEFGPLNRKGGRGGRGYHDQAVADIMRSVGLMPSHTGEPGGRETGHSIRHYVIPGGPFDVACRELLITGFTLRWRDNPRPRAAKGREAARAMKALPAPAATRAKFTCPGCQLNAWAKPGARLGCLTCSAPMSVQL